MYKNVWKKINQRGKTWKLRKGEQSFLCATCPNLIHIPTKLHEDILNGYRVKKHTRMLTDDSGKINQRGITQKLRKGEQPFLCMTHLPDKNILL